MAAARGVDASTKALTLRLTDYDEREFAGPVIKKRTFKESDAKAFLAAEAAADKAG